MIKATKLQDEETRCTPNPISRQSRIISEHLASQQIEKQRPNLKAFICKHVANREDAEDILQDVFYQFIKTVNNSMNPIEQVSTWLYRVARNLITNSGIKKREVELPVYQSNDSDDVVLNDFSEVLFINETAPSPEMEYLHSLFWVELENALAELPPEQRTIFELTEFDVIPVKDIAVSMGIAVNTLLSRKHYAVKHLRKRLKGLYEDIVYA